MNDATGTARQREDAVSTAERLAIVPPPDGDPTPDWIRRSPFYERAVEYARLTWWMLRSPRQFIQAWASGVDPMPNPLHFWLTMLAVRASAVQGVLRELLGAHIRASVLTQLYAELAQFVLLPLAVVIAHGICKLAGGTRPPRASLGALLWSGAGPQTVMIFSAILLVVVQHALGWTPHLVADFSRHTADASQPTPVASAYQQVPLELIGATWLGLAYVPLMLAGVHKVRLVWAALGFVVGLICLMLVGAALHAGLVAAAPALR